jgi:hypothetical protein
VEVDVTATPAAGYSFDHWGGNATNEAVFGVRPLPNRIGKRLVARYS